MALPHLIRGDIGQGGHGTPVVSMHQSSKSLTPELERKMGLCKHGGNPLTQSPVKPLCHSILLRPIPHSVSAHNPMVQTEVVKLLGHVLTPLVILQLSNLQIVLGPGICPEALKSRESLTFSLERDNSLELGPIINEGDPVLEPRVGLDRERTMEIRVDKT